jgi:8-oxo-dGTP pyrophosphatase MutT (NUDIX family)
MPSETAIATPETRNFWQPDVTVATIVVRDGALLMVEEDVQGRRVLNQPAGHLEPNESLIAAAIRETLEESGWDVMPTALVGLYQWKSPVDGRHFLRVALAADPVRHHPERSLDSGIVRALWLTPTQLQGEAERHRSPLVWRAVTDYLAGSRHPLSVLSHLA